MDGRIDGSGRQAGKKKHALLSVSAAPNTPSSVRRSSSGRCVAAECAQCRANSASSARTSRACAAPSSSSSPAVVAATAQSARITGSVGAGKSGGSPCVMGTPNTRAHRSRSRLIQVSLSVVVVSRVGKRERCSTHS